MIAAVLSMLDPPAEVELAVGERTNVSYGKASFYSVGVPEVIDVTTSPDHLGFDLRGVRPGVSYVLTIDADGTEHGIAIRVVQRRQ